MAVSLLFHEGAPREPVHVHAAKAGADAKLWLYPEVRLAYNRGVTARELREVQAIVTVRRDEIEKAWDEYFA